jgi:Sec-independent protein translocase protein TatA
MSNPLTEIFILGKAFTEVVSEKVEHTLTNILSDVGKFDAETKQRLEEFAKEVKARAEAQRHKSDNPTTITVEANTTEDLQELLDELRAEIARLKAELNTYRQKQ